MLKAFAFFAVFLFMCPALKADRIYILNGDGYNRAQASLITAIRLIGHTVYNDSTNVPALPSGFKTRCEDSVNGYDWLLIFTNKSITTLHNTIKTFIKNGGKVYIQYEVTCCNASSQAAADLVSAVVGLSISTNSNPYIALGRSPGWFVANFSCCFDTIYGHAYKGLDGVPPQNQFNASREISPATPPVSACTNFGFQFRGYEFTDNSYLGAIVGMGDVNLWYDGREPSQPPVNQKLVEFFFPGKNSTCYLYPPGCGKIQSPGNGKINIGNDTSICKGDSLVLKVSNSNNSLRWNGTLRQNTFTVKDSGVYFADMVTTCGTANDTIKVSIKKPPLLELGPNDTICSGSAVILGKTDTSNIKYRWQDGSTSSVFIADKPGLYFVRASNGSCTRTDSIFIFFHSKPQLRLGNDTVICSTMPLLLKNKPTIKVIWQNQFFDTVYTVNKAGLYFAELRHECDTVYDSINIDLEFPPKVRLGNDTAICSGNKVILIVSGSKGTIKWPDNSNDTFFVADKTGKYTVSISNRCGSDSDDLILEVTVFDPLKISGDTLLCLNKTMRINLWAPGVKYLWQDGSTMPYYTIESPGFYKVIRSKGFCYATDSFNVSFTDLPCECFIYLPDAFSPNDDGSNDVFGPVSNCNNLDYTLMIYNRWGELLFISDESNKTWNGLYRSEDAQMDVYMYKLVWKDPYTGITRFKAGTTTLLR